MIVTILLWEHFMKSGLMKSNNENILNEMNVCGMFDEREKYRVVEHVGEKV